jgi:site-specific recombinase XerD
MFEQIVKDPRARQRIERAGFKPGLDELRTKLHSDGYAEATVLFYEQAAAHFAFWLGTKQVDPFQVHEKHIAGFLSKHLPRCHCPIGGVREHKTVRAAVQHFRMVLGSGERLPSERIRKADAIEFEVQRFDNHLRTASGLQAATRHYRRRYVREFLHGFFGDGVVDASRLAPKDVIGYLLKRASAFKPGSAKVLASSLRSYLRFLRLHGECDEALILAVPAPPSYRLASLPRVLTDDEVTRLLAVFDRKTITGRRDYAITRCFTDLGLRTQEVARLRLDDIDWRKGTLRIVGSKTRRDDELPLIPSIAEAIAAYLRWGRRKSPERRVFLSFRPPVGRGMTLNMVRNVILRAAARAGMKSIVTGSRILRHTAATRMLRKGASMKEVADILRHRCLDTTTIYAKVDFPRLAVVAMPWPKEDER